MKNDSSAASDGGSFVNALGWSQLIDSFHKGRSNDEARSRIGSAFYDAGQEVLSRAEAEKLLAREVINRRATNRASGDDWGKLAADVAACLIDDCFANDAWRLDLSTSATSSRPDLSLELGLLESVEQISIEITEVMSNPSQPAPLPVEPISVPAFTGE
jgi:hypothetical protein